MGNFICDVIREVCTRACTCGARTHVRCAQATAADVMLLNSGTLRIDDVVSPGQIRIQEMV